jgi:hypothetical protein
VSWKRHKILELLASTFGYHNLNELTAAHKRGEIDLPQAEPIGEIALPNGESIVVVRDPLARAPYAIDQSFLERVAEERAETFGPPPMDISSTCRASSPRISKNSARLSKVDPVRKWSKLTFSALLCCSVTAEKP